MLTNLNIYIIIYIVQNRNASVVKWQTRMFKGHVRKSVGSTPTTRTKNKTSNKLMFDVFLSVNLL